MRLTRSMIVSLPVPLAISSYLAFFNFETFYFCLRELEFYYQDCLALGMDLLYLCNSRQKPSAA